MIYREFCEKTGRNEDFEISTEEYEELFAPFRDAQPEDPAEREIYRDTVGDIELRKLGLISPDVVADYAKYEALREEYADNLYGIPQHPSGEPCHMLKKCQAYGQIAASLMSLIELSVDSWGDY